MNEKLNDFFESYFKISKVQVGKQQTFDMLINEDALLLAKFFRNEREIWIPRICHKKANALVQRCVS